MKNMPLQNPKLLGTREVFAASTISGCQSTGVDASEDRRRPSCGQHL